MFINLLQAGGILHDSALCKRAWQDHALKSINAVFYTGKYNAETERMFSFPADLPHRWHYDGKGEATATSFDALLTLVCNIGGAGKVLLCETMKEWTVNKVHPCTHYGNPIQAAP